MNQNKKPSAESRRKMSEAKKGNKNRLGYKAKKETCVKISEANRGNNHHSNKLTEADVIQIKIYLAIGKKQVELAEIYGVTKYAISDIKRGITWKHIKIPPITGKKYGKLTLLEKSILRKGRGYKYKCLCECGQIIYAMLYDLKKGNVVSCGCYKKKNLRPSVETVKFYDGTNISNITSEKLLKNNTSGKKGVFWLTKKKRWQAVIMIRGKNIRLGTYKNFNDAVDARLEGEAKYFQPVIEEYKSLKNKP